MSRSEMDLLVNIVHAGLTLVGVKAGHALHAAVKEDTEVLVQMGEEEAVGSTLEY